MPTPFLVGTVFGALEQILGVKNMSSFQILDFTNIHLVDIRDKALDICHLVPK